MLYLRFQEFCTSTKNHFSCHCRTQWMRMQTEVWRKSIKSDLFSVTVPLVVQMDLTWKEGDSTLQSVLRRCVQCVFVELTVGYLKCKFFYFWIWCKSRVQSRRICTLPQCFEFFSSLRCGFPILLKDLSNCSLWRKFQTAAFRCTINSLTSTISFLWYSFVLLTHRQWTAIKDCQRNNQNLYIFRLCSPNRHIWPQNNSVGRECFEKMASNSASQSSMQPI